MSRYIHQLPDWPKFHWSQEILAEPLAAVRLRQGRLIGRMESLGFPQRDEAILQALTLDVLKSSEIEGEILNPEQVRSSIARRLGMDIAGLVPADRQVDGVVEMMLEATQNYAKPLTVKRLFGWHIALFPNAGTKIRVGAWRDDARDQCRSFPARLAESACIMRLRQPSAWTQRWLPSWIGQTKPAPSIRSSEPPRPTCGS